MDNKIAKRMVEKAKVAKRWRLFTRHKCPAQVIIEVKIDGRTIVGPMTGENLAIIAKYSGTKDMKINLLDGIVGTNIEVTAQYES